MGRRKLKFLRIAKVYCTKLVQNSKIKSFTYTRPQLTKS